jgi:hypothetical protein
MLSENGTAFTYEGVEGRLVRAQVTRAHTPLGYKQPTNTTAFGGLSSISCRYSLYAIAHNLSVAMNPSVQPLRAPEVTMLAVDAPTLLVPLAPRRSPR